MERHGEMEKAEEQLNGNDAYAEEEGREDEGEVMAQKESATTRRTESLKLRADNLQISGRMVIGDEKEFPEGTPKITVEQLRRRSQMVTTVDNERPQVFINDESMEMTLAETVTTIIEKIQNEQHSEMEPTNDELGATMPIENASTTEVTNTQSGERTEVNAANNEINAKAEQKDIKQSLSSVGTAVSGERSACHEFRQTEMTTSDDHAKTADDEKSNAIAYGTTTEEPIPMIDEGSPVASGDKSEPNATASSGGHQCNDGAAHDDVDSEVDSKVVRLRQRIKQACSLI